MKLNQSRNKREGKYAGRTHFRWVASGGYAWVGSKLRHRRSDWAAL